MRHAGRQQAQAHQPVLRLQPFQRLLQFVFVLAQFPHRRVVRRHDLADLVTGNLFCIDDLALAVALARGDVGVQQDADRLVHVARQDHHLQQQHSQQVDYTYHAEHRHLG